MAHEQIFTKFAFHVHRVLETKNCDSEPMRSYTAVVFALLIAIAITVKGGSDLLETGVTNYLPSCHARGQLLTPTSPLSI
jgi:hypothetical protein